MKDTSDGLSSILLLLKWLSFEKALKLDEELVRYLVVTTVAENTVYTKRAPVIKAETLVDNETDDGTPDINIDTTKDADVVGEIAPEVLAEVATSEEVK